MKYVFISIIFIIAVTIFTPFLILGSKDVPSFEEDIQSHLINLESDFRVVRRDTLRTLYLSLKDPLESKYLEYEDNRLIPYIVENLYHDDHWVRYWSGQYLCSRAQKDNVCLNQVHDELYNDLDPDVAKNLMLTLGDGGPMHSGFYGSLSKWAYSTESDLRLYAVYNIGRLLGGLNDSSIYNVLNDALMDENDEVKIEALKAILNSGITDIDKIGNVHGLVDNEDEEIKSLAIEIINK